MRVLITCGATWIPIDDVRVISNVSSGEMGHLIAQAFLSNRASVTIIEGPVTHAFIDKRIKVIKYRYFDELACVLKKELLKKYDIIIHSAAVSDFSATIRGGSSKIFGVKVHSDRPLTLKLFPTPKLINDIKALSPESFLVGFKLEPELNPKYIFKVVRSLFTSAACDLVVANTLKSGYRGFIVDADGNILNRSNSKQKIAETLVKFLSSGK